MRLSLRVCLFLWLGLFALPAAAAELRLGVGAEQFVWEEFDASGSRLLEEKGPRFHVALDWDNRDAAGAGVWYGVNGRLYLGVVDYDGQACDLSGNCVPAQSDTEYVGLLAEGLVGTPIASSSVDIFGGVGLDTWARDIQSTIDSTGRAVSGASETYSIFYAKLGLGTGSETWRLQGGIKYPFYTDEYIEIYDLSLSPEGRVSAFARLEMRVAPKARLAFYYDSYRFGASDPEYVVVSGLLLRVWQPESHMDAYGAQLLFSF